MGGSAPLDDTVDVPLAGLLGAIARARHPGVSLGRGGADLAAT
jgi:hypothetical protein